MNLNAIIKIVGNEPVFETSLLLAGKVNPDNVRRQLSRLAGADKLYQLRRGLYALAPPLQKVKPQPFLVANRLVRGSYVSCQSALAFYGLIPEYVPTTTSVTTARPARWETPLGVFEFRHLSVNLLRGYMLLDLGERQKSFVAKPEKALLDLIHLHPGGDSPDYLRELRLQNLEQLNLDELQRQAELSGKPKWLRAVKFVTELAVAESEEYETL